jgi:hypothetical protein
MRSLELEKNSGFANLCNLMSCLWTDHLMDFRSLEVPEDRRISPEFYKMNNLKDQGIQFIVLESSLAVLHRRRVAVINPNLSPKSRGSFNSYGIWSAKEIARLPRCGSSLD